MREWKISKFKKVVEQFFYCYNHVQLLRPQAFQNSHFEISPYKITPLYFTLTNQIFIKLFEKIKILESFKMPEILLN
jgi:hypothetical protein